MQQFYTPLEISFLKTKLSNQVLQSVPNLDEWIDKILIEKYKFTSWKDAVEKLHNPEIDDTYNEKIFIEGGWLLMNYLHIN